MAVNLMSGFETGDTSEWPTIVTGAGGAVSIVTSPVITGNYACKIQSATTEAYIKTATGLNKSTFCSRCRIYVHVTTNPAGGQDFTFIRFVNATDNTVGAVSLVVNADGTLNLYAAVISPFAQAGPTVTISVDTVYLIEAKVVVTGSSSTLEWKIDGVSKGTAQNSNTANVDAFYLRMSLNSGDAYCIFDDVLLDDANFPGMGRCLARQGKIGAPTYDTFTKVVGSTAQECWSETPFSATKSCTSIVNGGAQTMLAESFANIQSGHGTEKLWTGKGLTINACKVAVIAKVGVGSSHSIRRRLNGADTDTAKTITTSDAYYDDGFWTDTLTNINSMEIGVLHGANVNLLTIEDMWIMIDVEKRWILGPH